EIKEIVTEYKVKEIGFNDDTFTLNAVRVRDFCNKYPQVVGNVPFYVNARVNAVSRETFILLGKAGCKRVNMGVECGDPKIRNEILERDMTDEQIIQTFNWARDAGIETYAFNMIGLPYETKESIQKTIDLNRKINPDYLGCSIFTALPGTPLYELCKKNGWLAPEYSTSYFQDSNMIHPNFTVDELKVFRDNFGFEVYKGIRPMRAYIDKFDKTLIKFSPYVKTRSILLRFGAKHVMNKKWEKRRSKIDFDKSLENINIA
ncbi:MAG: radical SAM protein, partial [Nanoarchaeota archaeon]